MTTLNPRQKQLKQRLEIFCNRIQREQFPLFIKEVWGFGSFFRLKDKPRDIDLVLKSSGINPIYKRFEDIFKKSLSKTSEYNLPKDAFLDTAKLELTKKDFEEHSSLFVSWIEHYTWNMIFGGILSIPEMVVNESDITKRVLIKELKGIQIFQIISHDKSLDSLRAENINLIWSDTKPDTSSNLEVLLSPENIRLARIIELESFDKQISSHKKEYDVIIGLLEYVKKLKNLTVDFDDFNETLEKKAYELFPDISDEIIPKIIKNVRHGHPDEQVVPPTTDLNYDGFTDSEIKENVEIKRTELKNIQKKLVVSRSVLFFQYYNSNNEKNEWQKRLSLQQLVIMDVLLDIPKKIVSEEKIREILKELDFPEHQVLREKYMRGVYTVPENKEERIKIVRRNQEIETKAKYHRILQPTIKQFSKDTWFEVELDKEYKPIYVRLNYYHRNYSEEKIPESVNKVVQFLRGSGFKMTFNKYSIDGTMSIQVNNCQTNKEIKGKVIDSLK